MAVKRETLIGLGGAVLLHLLLLAVLGIRLPDSKPEPVASSASNVVIEARAVSEDEVMAPVRQRQAEEAEQQRRIEAEKRAAAERRRAEEQARRKAEEERQATIRRQAEEKQRVEAQRKADAEAKLKLEAQRKAEAEAKQKVEAQRKAEAEAKQKAEAQRKAEEEARKKAEAEAKRKAEEEAKRRAAEEAKRKADEQALRESLDAEQRRLDAEAARLRQTQLARLEDEYKSQIGDKVRRNWLRPDGSRGTLCEVSISQLPDGEVVGVRILRCDEGADAAFQRSVENAVRRASPLPLPADRAVFKREIQFNFRPQ